MIIDLTNEENFDTWAEVHYAKQGWDLSILEEETVPVNPYADEGIYNTWAIMHAPERLTKDFPPPHITMMVGLNQISVWYTRIAVHANPETPKALNLYKMIETALAYELQGRVMTKMPSPVVVDTKFSTHTMNMIEFKIELRKANKFTHVLHEDFINKGATSMSALKSKTSAENFAKAREAARLMQIKKADERAKGLLARVDLGASKEELAVYLGCAVGSVDMSVSRARKRFEVDEVAPEPAKPLQRPVTPAKVGLAEMTSMLDEDIVREHDDLQWADGILL